ncbi:MAG TPA: prenyltransferase/squalene oxidase repeat-containing protein [Blastocatellia bacterium]
MVTAPRNETTEWLLAGDPAIRWQVLNDLLGAPESAVERQRGRIAREGWGARLLARQDPEGTWAGGQTSDRGLYSPKWTSTTYTMLTLRDFGLPPNNRQARKACRLLLEEGAQPDGGFDYGIWAGWRGQSETCVTGMILSILTYFGYEDDHLDRAADNLLNQQMPDGGWNCRRRMGATHSSVHTTISVLEALRQYELTRRRKVRAVRAAQERGREFLLVHRLFRSHTTGEIIKPEFLRFYFPPRWHYDILRGLDYFQAVNAAADQRLADAIEVVRQARRADGRWRMEYRYRGKTYFQIERLGAASRWNTLRALRVLKWWENGN